MKLEVFADDEATARAAAKQIAAEASAAVAARGSFVMAVSGGRTPWIMLRALAKEDLPWKNMHIVQVDERVAPAGSESHASSRKLAELADSPGADPRHAGRIGKPGRCNSAV
jgi:6-phosphogluconolactonase/glucosamine-6-phosphate isomerase/deaminase